MPEVELYLASELTPLWYATAELLEAYEAPTPFWAFAWAGGQALARYVLDHPELVRGRRVVDFASGGGLVAIAAKRAGAAHVTAVEIDPWASSVIPLNAGRNGVELEVHIGDVLQGDFAAAFDVLLAGDVFYERPLAEGALAWMRRLARGGTQVVVGDPGRTYSPPDLPVLAEYLVPTSVEIERQDLMPARVLAVR